MDLTDVLMDATVTDGLEMDWTDGLMDWIDGLMDLTDAFDRWI